MTVEHADISGGPHRFQRGQEVTAENQSQTTSCLPPGAERRADTSTGQQPDQDLATCQLPCAWWPTYGQAAVLSCALRAPCSLYLATGTLGTTSTEIACYKSDSTGHLQRTGQQPD